MSCDHLSLSLVLSVLLSCESSSLACRLHHFPLSMLRFTGFLCLSLYSYRHKDMQCIASLNCFFLSRLGEPFVYLFRSFLFSLPLSLSLYIYIYLSLSLSLSLALSLTRSLNHNMLTPQREVTVTANFLAAMKFQNLQAAFSDVWISVPVSPIAIDSSKFAHTHEPTTELVVCHKLAPATQTFNRPSKNRGKFTLDLPNPPCGFPMDAFRIAWRLLPSKCT